MKHGEVRNHHYENEMGEQVHVFEGGGVTSVCERWCTHCQKWVTCKGVTGNLAFMAQHKHEPSN